MKNSIFLFITIFLIFLLSGCAEKKTYKIGVSQCSSDDWREQMNDEMNREILLHDDVEVEIRSADDDSRKQIADIQYFIDNDFDIIIVSPNEKESLTPVIDKIYESGTPVIIFDRDIKSESYTEKIGVDNEELGHSAAEYALNLLPGGVKAIEIYGLRGSTPAEDRSKGFKNKILGNNGIILGTGAADWNKENAEIVADSLLRLYPETNLIFAHNDRMAIGASEVAKREGRDDIKVIGIDAAPQIGIKAVADGVIDATFLYPTEGHVIIREAIKIIKGEPHEKILMLPQASAVDSSNADILLLQNEMMAEDTKKVKVLKEQIEDYWEVHSAQTSLFYAIIVILILLFGILFLVLRTFWQHRRHQEILLRQNRLLQEERDKQKELNIKLEEATQSKLMFFTNVSHDLRTPLTLIAEPVSQLSKANNLNDSQKALMKIADKNVKILQRLINQILDFRKYENNRLDLHLTEVDFSKVVKDWLDSFSEIARKRHISLTLNDDSNGGASNIAIDVEKIERVFFNLISNAMKYSPENSSITVDYKIDKDSLILKVTDTGQGISRSDIGNIFDRFYQVDKVRPRGSGIGLSLAKAFVELHGGTITVESELKKGSVFTVILPVKHVADKPVEVENGITGEDVNSELEEVNIDTIFDEGKPLLLIIDDNRDIREMVGELMSDEYNIITAPTGSEGIKRAAKYVPDLIICDVMMPGIDGLETCRRLKSEITTSHIPVLMLTACSMDEQRVQGFESGADGYLAKPFSADVLRSQSRSLIENRKRIKETSNSLEMRGNKKMDTDKKEMPRTKDIENDFYNRFLDIFNQEMANPDVSVETLASKMGLERTQFYRKIKALTNYSPVELMKNLRLKEARRRLTITDKSISEICYEVGFSTPAYFTKCYREMYGETPSETRSQT